MVRLNVMRVAHPVGRHTLEDTIVGLVLSNAGSYRAAVGSLGVSGEFCSVSNETEHTIAGSY